MHLQEALRLKATNAKFVYTAEHCNFESLPQYTQPFPLGWVNVKMLTDKLKMGYGFMILVKFV